MGTLSNGAQAYDPNYEIISIGDTDNADHTLAAPAFGTDPNGNPKGGAGVRVMRVIVAGATDSYLELYEGTSVSGGVLVAKVAGNAVGGSANIEHVALWSAIGWHTHIVDSSATLKVRISGDFRP